ncbi:MAG: hypothetical protein QOK10_3785 [Pseudonocardiales bacterium]|nr:hypothetical protein [Pseudonocardiales bacterium]
MRKVLSAVLVLIGVFCIVLAALLRFYAPGKALKTPLNLNIKLVATGPAEKLDASGQLQRLTLNATRRVRSDSQASDSKVTVIQETLCIVVATADVPECVDKDDAQGRLVSFTTDRVAADRKSAESVNDPKYHENINGASAKHTGLTYKWPFDAKKQSYPFYDPNAQQAPEAKYIGTEKLLGLTLYKYEAVITGADVPVGPGIPGKYDDTRTVWVDPKTGTIIKGVEHQVRTLADGTKALETTLTFDPASQKYQADFAKDAHKKINLLTIILPVVLGLLGLISLAFGLLLARRQTPASAGAHASNEAVSPARS